MNRIPCNYESLGLVLHVRVQHRRESGRAERPKIGRDEPAGLPHFHQHLGEVKMISRGHYSSRMKKEPSAAVKSRALGVFTEYRKKARDADRMYNGTTAGAVGPVEQCLHLFGVVRACVFSVCGETTPPRGMRSRKWPCAEPRPFGVE
jgi:hypothetical protein